MTPLVTTTFAPSQQLSPMRVGPLLSKPCQVIGFSGSSKRWLASETKQPLASMQCSPISTSSWAATITPRFRNVPAPIRTRALPGAVIHTPGSSSTPGADLQAPLAQRLEHVAVHGPAHERLAAHELPVDPARGSRAASCAHTSATSAPTGAAGPRASCAIAPGR